MDQDKPRQRRRRKMAFTEALKQKYCVDQESQRSVSGFVIEIAFHGKPKDNGSDAELAYLRNVILNNSGISVAGMPQGGLSSLCPNVVDLDLSGNFLNDWSEVLDIMSHLPHLKYVNLARNSIQSKSGILERWETTLPGIENLVLNGTMVTWSDMLKLSKFIPTLKELHMCENDYDSVSCNNTDITQHLPNLSCLRLNSNRIQSWEEIWKFRHLPNLQSLILSENPLIDVAYDHKNDNETEICDCDQSKDFNGNQAVKNEIQNIVNDLVQDTFRSVVQEEAMVLGSFEDTLYVPEENEVTSPDIENDDITEEIGDNSECDIFEMSVDESTNDNGIICTKCGKFKRDILETKPFSNLSTLCLSQTKLKDWKHMEALSRFPSLKSVRVMDIELTSEISKDDRRKLQIACLPNISILNGSEVTWNDRDIAERHYLRFFMDKEHKPNRYHELVKKHGKPKPIVDIHIRPEGFQEWINLTIVFKDQSITSKVRVVEPVGKLRLYAAKKFCLYASLKNFKMFHLACGPFHREEDKVFEELILESLPMSRFDIMEGDQVHINLDDDDGYTDPKGFLQYFNLGSYIDIHQSTNPTPQSPPKNIAFVVKP